MRQGSTFGLLARPYRHSYWQGALQGISIHLLGSWQVLITPHALHRTGIGESMPFSAAGDSHRVRNWHPNFCRNPATTTNSLRMFIKESGHLQPGNCGEVNLEIAMFLRYFGLCVRYSLLCEYQASACVSSPFAAGSLLCSPNPLYRRIDPFRPIILQTE